MAEKRGKPKKAQVTVTDNLVVHEVTLVKAGEPLTVLWQSGSGDTAVVVCRRDSDGKVMRVPRPLIDWL